MKIMVVLGTRPEAIKLAPVIREALRHTERIELTVCSTGQHREMLDQALAVFAIKPDIELAVMQPNQTLAGLTARLLEQLDGVFRQHTPDGVVVQGDTTTAFAAGLAAFYQQITVAHVEAGLRTGDLQSPFPEELNRVMIGRMARWHFAPTLKAGQNLRHEGITDTSILITGNTVVDAIDLLQQQWQQDGGISKHLDLFPGRRQVLITAHRRENFGSGLQQICAAVKTLCEKYPDIGFIFPVHLNPQVRSIVHAMLSSLPNLKLLEPVNFQESLYLQSWSTLIITDSGGIQEEAPSFGVPVVVMREHTERSEGIEAGFATLAGTDPDAIVAAAVQYLDNPELTSRLNGRSNPYGDGRAASRIMQALLGEPIEAWHA